MARYVCLRDAIQHRYSKKSRASRARRALRSKRRNGLNCCKLSPTGAESYWGNAIQNVCGPSSAALIEFARERACDRGNRISRAPSFCLVLVPTKLFFFFHLLRRNAQNVEDVVSRAKGSILWISIYRQLAAETLKLYLHNITSVLIKFCNLLLNRMAQL